MVHWLDAPLAGWIRHPLYPSTDYPGNGAKICLGARIASGFSKNILERKSPRARLVLLQPPAHSLSRL